jgi:hypothetical protein
LLLKYLLDGDEHITAVALGRLERTHKKGITLFERLEQLVAFVRVPRKTLRNSWSLLLAGELSNTG